jgi:hypothetical protein
MNSIYSYDDYDPPLPVFSFPDWDTMTNMTAIVAVSLPGSLVVGADGLRTESSGNVVTQEGHKIRIHKQGRKIFSYTWCGDTVIWMESEDTGLRHTFDFAGVSSEVLKDISFDSDLKSFLDNFCILFRDRFEKADYFNEWCDTPWTFGQPSKSKARMLMCGFWEGKVFFVEIVASHLDKNVEIQGRSLFPQPRAILAFNGACPNVELANRRAQNVQEARNLICEYIYCCSENPNSKGVGKMAHIAQIAPDSFEWIDLPTSPVDSSTVKSSR